MKSYKVRSVNPETDPLDWWSSNQRAFPRIAKMAKMHLAIPASSTESERVFSSSGDLINKKKAAISPELAKWLVTLHETWVMNKECNKNLWNKIMKLAKAKFKESKSRPNAGRHNNA